MHQRTSKSALACVIDHNASAAVRLKTSGSSGYTLSACKTWRYGAHHLKSGKASGLLEKMSRWCSTWREEELVLCVGTETLLPLPVTLPIDATPDEIREYCRMEAEYFVSQPNTFCCDRAPYANKYASEYAGEHDSTTTLLLFYPAQPCSQIADHFAANHRLLFAGTTHRALIHLSTLMAEPLVMLELGEQSVTFMVARNGAIEWLSSHQVKTQDEAEYFTMKELMEHPICRQTTVYVTGSRADKAILALIDGDKAFSITPLCLPSTLSTLSISNPQQFALASPVVVKAISAALMGLEGENAG